MYSTLSILHRAMFEVFVAVTSLHYFQIIMPIKSMAAEIILKLRSGYESSSCPSVECNAR